MSASFVTKPSHDYFFPSVLRLVFSINFPQISSKLTTTRTTNYFYAHGGFQHWSKLGWKIRGFMWALLYWDLSKSPLCLGVSGKNNAINIARAVNICSLPAKEFPCKFHQSPKIPWHVIFSFLLLILEAATVTDRGKRSAPPPPPFNRESF